MADENPEEISHILFSMQRDEEQEAAESSLLPTLTLYIGERSETDPKPPVDLHLSLGGSYSSTENAALGGAGGGPSAVENSFMFEDHSSMLKMKRSYLEQNKLVSQNDQQEEIILINNDKFGGGMISSSSTSTQGPGNKQQKSRKREASPDLEWAARSASENPALRRALQIIKSESSICQRPTTRTKAHHHNQLPTVDHAIPLGIGSQPDGPYNTYDMSNAIQDMDCHQADIVMDERGNSINPDDFLSISAPLINVDFGLSLPSSHHDKLDLASKATSSAGTFIPAAVSAPMNGVGVGGGNRNRDKGKSVMVDHENSASEILSATATPPPISTNYNNYYYYYGTSSDGNLINNLCAAPNYNRMGPQGTMLLGGGGRSENSCFSSNTNYPPPPVAAAATVMMGANPHLLPPLLMQAASQQYYDPYIASAANANSSQRIPPAAAFAFTGIPVNHHHHNQIQWANASIPVGIPISGFPPGGSNNSSNSSNCNINIPPAEASKRSHPSRMRRNVEYHQNSHVEMIKYMPTVATDGGVPDGRRIEGFLYQYSNYEEVVIVCFCHGSFFSPREFVMHAGGPADQLDNPMKLITIVPED